jgi:hypothetical protein
MVHFTASGAVFIGPSPRNGRWTGAGPYGSLPPGIKLWDMGVSINGSTPKWMVYNGKYHQNGWWYPGYHHDSGNLHISTTLYTEKPMVQDWSMLDYILGDVHFFHCKESLENVRWLRWAKTPRSHRPRFEQYCCFQWGWNRQWSAQKQQLLGYDITKNNDG